MTHSTEPLSALALTQLRLDFEAVAKEAGRRRKLPLDHEFFDSLEANEDELEDEMQRLGLADQFLEMRERAQARFPEVEIPAGTRVQWFVDRYRSQNWLGIRGLLAHAATWLDAQQLEPAEFEQFAAAVNLPNGSSARAMIEELARGFAKARKMGLSSHSCWSRFAVATLLNEEQFELLTAVADDMGLMFADELLEALHAESLAERMARRLESGGAPSVFYRAIAVTTENPTAEEAS